MTLLGSIAERLRTARKNLGLTQEEAAEKSDISVRTIGSYETDGIRDLIALEKMCSTYSISIADVIVGRDNLVQDDLANLADLIDRIGPSACKLIIALCRASNPNNPEPWQES